MSHAKKGNPPNKTGGFMSAKDSEDKITSPLCLTDSTYGSFVLTFVHLFFWDFRTHGYAEYAQSLHVTRRHDITYFASDWISNPVSLHHNKDVRSFQVISLIK